MTYLSEIIEEFLMPKNFKKYLGYTSFNKMTVSNLLYKLKENYDGDELEETQLQFAMKDTVMSYTSTKLSAIKIFKIFLKFLKDENDFKGVVSFPEIDISNSFERQMYLAKALQKNEMKMESLSEKLWISERTLEEDIARIRGKSSDPIQICGMPFIIDEVERKNGKFSFASTVHPFFLTFNLTQVIATLKGLKKMSLEPAMERYAIGSAAAIWQQLSDYAKERIIYVMTEIMPEESSWYESLDAIANEIFQTEYQYRSVEGPGVLMDCMKNEKICHVEYQREDETIVFLTNCKFIPKSYQGDGVEVSSDQGNEFLDFSKIIRSSYTKENLI